MPRETAITGGMEASTAAESHEAAVWAVQEFGDARLGNVKRTERLVSMAGAVMERPGGRITSVFQTTRELEGAYRFVENEHVDHCEVGAAAWRACARRSRGLTFAFVPIDGCSLTLKDATGSKGYGPVGTSKDEAMGVRSINAVGLSPEGVPLGMAGQVLWTRSRQGTKKHRTERAFHEKETANWLRVMEQVNRVFDEEGGALRWFQVDAEGDFRELLDWAEQTKQLVTVRAGQDRRLVDAGGRLLWETMQATPVCGEYSLRVRGNKHRKARTANIVVRHREVQLQPLHAHQGDRPTITLHAVLAQEAGTTPEGEKPIEWLLLTNFYVSSFDDAILVVHGYTQRWRVEEFHKAWQSVCEVEDSQLHFCNFVVWATILSSVAMKIETMKYLSREEPDTPATELFSEYEIEAAALILQPKDYEEGATHTVGQVVRWIADIGGYTGKSSGGPPGTIVLSRGWSRVEPAAIAVRRIRERGKT